MTRTAGATRGATVNPVIPTFTAELTAQVELALSEQREAEVRGDAEAAEVAAGRVADLRELHARSAEPLVAPA